MATPKIGDGMLGWLGATPMESDPSQLQSVGPMAPIPMSESGGWAWLPQGPTEQEQLEGNPGLRETFYKIAEQHPGMAAGVANLIPPIGAVTGMIAQTPEDIQKAAGVIADRLEKERASPNPDAWAANTPGSSGVVPQATPTPTQAPEPGSELPPMPMGPGYFMPKQELTPERIKKTKEEQDKAAADVVALQNMAVERDIQLQELQADREAKVEQARLQREARQQADETAMRETYRKTSDELKNVPSINPDRYWQNKSGFQKGMSALAGFLFGLSGKGMDYLHLIEQEIDRDVNAQKFDYENKRQSIQARLGAVQNEYQMFRDSGLNARQSELAAKVHRLDDYKRQAAVLAASSGSYVSKANANLAAAKLQETADGRLLDFDKETSNRAAAQNSFNLQKFGIESGNWKALAGKAPGEVKPGLVQKPVERLGVLEGLKQLEIAYGALGEPGHTTERYKRAAKAAFGFDPEASALIAMAESLKMAFGKDLMGSMPENERKQLDKIFAGGLAWKDSSPILRRLRETMAKQTVAELEGALDVGQPVDKLISRVKNQYYGIPGEESR